VKRILLLLDQKENQHLMAEELGGTYEIVVGSRDADLDQDFDLCVLDGAALDRLWERVLARKDGEHPILLPILLVTSRPGVKMITRQLWRSVDDLIITPIEKPELRARIEVLLRGRALSVALRQRAEVAEQATRMKDEVLALVSHDLRNPLNLVFSSASLMLESEGGLDPQQEDRIRMIHRAAGLMNRLIQDLLDISRLEAGHFSIQTRLEDVEPVVREACAVHEFAAAEKSIEIECVLGDHLPPVQVDRDRLLQVFGNLIGNSLKFTPRGGQVSVKAEGRAEDVLVSVSDTGPGITESDLPHVFDRFWQARPTPTGGAGLGLAIARGIVTAHGGDMWVVNDEDRGSTFCFTLPTGRDPGAAG
jgi:signal transduction histidine kinase